MYETYLERINTLAEEVNQLRAQLAADHTLMQSLKQYERQLRAGQLPPLRDHIRRVHHPASEQELQANRLAEIWAAASIGVLLLGFVNLLIFARDYLFHGVVAIVYAIAFIEAGFRHRLSRFLSNVASILATLTALVILYEFFFPILALFVILAAGYILWENLRELRG
jgi:hypothetical protein